MAKLTQNILKLGTACMIAFATTVVMAQEGNMPEPRPMPEKMMQHQREMMEKRYATMDTEKLMKRKEMLEQRIQNAKNDRQKQHFEMELEVINTIINN